MMMEHRLVIISKAKANSLNSGLYAAVFDILNFPTTLESSDWPREYHFCLFVFVLSTLYSDFFFIIFKLKPNVNAIYLHLCNLITFIATIAR